MKNIKKLLIAATFCLFIAGLQHDVIAQDASHYETATAEDSGDWGLLGLLGLIGLFGLRKKKEPVDDRIMGDRTGNV